MGPSQSTQRFAREFPGGSVLFRQGEQPDFMYVIQAGKVQISRNCGGRDTVLAVLPPGEFFGEMSILNNRPRSATATVVEDAQLLAIDANTFGAMIRGSAEIAARLIQKLASRLSEASRQIELLMYRDPNSRVVHCLRQAAEASGTPDAAGIAVSLTEQTLADRLGLSVAEVNHVLLRLERARLVRRDGEGVFVVAEVGKLQDFLDFLEMKERYGKS